jgi:hypothetical protein
MERKHVGACGIRVGMTHTDADRAEVRGEERRTLVWMASFKRQIGRVTLRF